MCCARAASGRRCPANTSAAPAQSTSGFWNGSKLDSFRCSGGRGWPSTMRWRVLLGDGKASTGHYGRHRRHGDQSGPTPPTHEKSGSKRTLLVDASGVPLSIVVTGANRHDVTQIVATLDASIGLPLHRAPASTLYADAGLLVRWPSRTTLDRAYTLMPFGSSAAVPGSAFGSEGYVRISFAYASVPLTESTGQARPAALAVPGQSGRTVRERAGKFARHRAVHAFAAARRAA